MTDETQAEWRRLFERLARWLADPNRDDGSLWRGGWATGVGGLTLAHFADPRIRAFDDLPPLTPAQHLALSVLLGEVNPNVLADYMLDQGHEYATACYERGRAEEQTRCLHICLSKAAPWGQLRQDAWDEGNLEVCDRAECREWMATNIADAIQKGVTVGEGGMLVDPIPPRDYDPDADATEFGADF